MSGKEHLSKLADQLAAKKARGVKEVCWTLKGPQLQYVQELGYKVIPELYEVNLRSVPSINQRKSSSVEVPHVMVYLAREKSHGRKKLVMRLNSREYKALNMWGVSFKPIKYKILLVHA